MKDPEGEKERELLLAGSVPALESGRGLRGLPLSPAEEKLIRSFAFLSLKPLLHFINIDEKDLASVRRPGVLFPGLAAPRPNRGHVPAGEGRRSWPSAAGSKPTSPSSKRPNGPLSWPSTGWPAMSAPLFAGQAAAFLDRISFFTVGKDEVRAWTVDEGRHGRRSRRGHPLRHRQGLHPGRGRRRRGAPPPRDARTRPRRPGPSGSRAGITSSGTGTSSTSGSPHERRLPDDGPGPALVGPDGPPRNPPRDRRDAGLHARGQPGHGQGLDPRPGREPRRRHHPAQFLPPVPAARASRTSRPWAACTASSPGPSPS